MMKPMKVTLIAATLTALAGLQMPAFAQPMPHTEYCSALSAEYQRYIETDGAHHPGRIQDSATDHAMAQCQTHAAAAIPVLERALKNAKNDPPPPS